MILGIELIFLLIIQAVGIHKCSEYHESTVSDESGSFRIRGLQVG